MNKIEISKKKKQTEPDKFERVGKAFWQRGMLLDGERQYRSGSIPPDNPREFRKRSGIKRIP
jgi:hypothetical protein